MKKYFFILIILLTSASIKAQREKIELLGADELEGVIYKGSKANLLKGNVRIKHEGSIMACDKGYLYVGKNDFDAFGNVSIRQDRGMTIYGDSLFYNGDTKIAKIRGNVRVIDKSMTLTTKKLDYNMGDKTAKYFGGGTIVDKNTNLKSDNGYFNSNNDYYTFKGNVKVLKDGYTIVSDTMKYVSTSQKVYFYGPTTVYSTDQTLYAESGTFNTKENKAWFNKNAWVETPTYKLFGDSLYFDNNKNYGYAVNNVKMISYTEKATIYGDVAINDGQKFQKTVYGNALLVDYSEQDTTYIQADTLISIDNPITKKKQVKALQNVKVIKGTLSALSDFMIYNTADSNIIFKKDPILWSGQNQIIGDSVKIMLVNNKVDKMYIYQNAFLIAQNERDTTHYDQIKGKTMVAYFNDSELDRLDVDGNGESIYYALDEEKEFLGVNHVVCGNMKMYVVDGDMNLVKFYDRPIATFTPPHLLEGSKIKLDGFSWQIAKRPESKYFTDQTVNRKRSETTTTDKIIIAAEPKVEAKELDKKSRKEQKRAKKGK